MPSGPNLQDLRRHYASLSDDALLALERSELTEVAQRCWDEEVASRKIATSEEDEHFSDVDGVETEIEAEWRESAAVACSFGPQDTDDLDEACRILEEAGVTYHVNAREEEDRQGQPYVVQDVVVPAPLLLFATSVLDREMFNAQQEADWKAHLAELSDEDFRSIKIEDLTAGMLDRVERLKRVYADERAHRDA
jgi:hypothetical protein